MPVSTLGDRRPVSTLGNRGQIPTLGDRRFMARAGLALALANVRYWTSVAPIVRGELRRWERRAQAIDDPQLRALALEKLGGEGFHAEAAAMLATRAPRSYRRDVVEAIVALELLFDYLDGLTERPSADPLRDGERLFGAYVQAVTVATGNDGSLPTADARNDLPLAHAESDDGGYLSDLSRATTLALARLPAAWAITEIAQRTAARAAQAQTRMHAASQLGTEQVEQWARREADGTEEQWHELLAGAASSVLVLHALIAAAADPGTTPEEAGEIESAYLSTCTVLTLLDGLVDHDQDTASSDAEHLSYISFYRDPEELSRTLTGAARRALARARALPAGAHHAITLVGVVAYYTSAPGAQTALARPICRRLQHQLRPLIFPTLALMHTWRKAKRVRARNRRAPRGGGLASSLEETHERTRGCNEI